MLPSFLLVKIDKSMQFSLVMLCVSQGDEGLGVEEDQRWLTTCSPQRSPSRVLQAKGLNSSRGGGWGDGRGGATSAVEEAQ